MNTYRCLSYHGFGGNRNKYTLDKKAFVRHLTLIKKNNLSFKSLEEVNAINYDKASVALTFDDGFTSDVWAAEKLMEFGYSATFFLVASNIRGSNRMYMNKAQVKEISDMGHSVGVHGKTHTWWTSKPTAVLLQELNDTKKYLQDLTSSEVVSCSAVGGKLNNKILKALNENQEFKFVRNTIPWFTTINAFEVNSTIIIKGDTEHVFLKKATGDLNCYRYLFAKQFIKNGVKKVLGK